MSTEINVAGLEASTAPAARSMPIVRGSCPTCGLASLFLASGGYVTCASLTCSSPTAVADGLLTDRLPAAVGAESEKTPAEADRWKCPGCKRWWGEIEAGHGHAENCPRMGPPPREAFDA